MPKPALVALLAAALALPAAAQGGGSTYQSGSNLPQRSAGEVGAKTAGGSLSGSGGTTGANKPGKKPARKAADRAKSRAKPPA